MDGKDAKASTTSSISSTTATDDESITTSTESEAFDETWTLVTDKSNQQIKIGKELKPDEDENQRIETLTKNKSKQKGINDINPEGHDNGVGDEDEEAEAEEDGEEAIDSDKDNYGRKSDHDNTADDELSDGISIISESESAGRISPGLSGERLSNMNLKMTLGENYIEELIPRAKLNFPIKLSASAVQPVADINENQSQLIRRRRRSGSHSSADKHKKAIKQIDVARFNEMPNFVRKGLSGLFYAGVVLAFLTFLGKIRMFFWQSSQPEAQNLEQKVIDIEMQNNLMRAEIDLLTKQVSYLNNVNGPIKSKGPYKAPYQAYQQKDFNQKEKYDKRKEQGTFKAWSGHGGSLDPIEISKKDLKKPFQCPDGKYIQFGGMCIENPAPQTDKTEEENVIDPLATILDNIVDNTGPLKDFVQIGENINIIAENPFDALKPTIEINNNEASPLGQKNNDASAQPEVLPSQPNQQNNFDQHHLLHHGQSKWEQKPYKPNEKTLRQEFKKFDDRKSYYPKNNENSKERFNSGQRHHAGQRNFKEFRKQDINSKEHSQDKHYDSSKERFKERKNDESKEGSNERKNIDSKERYNRNNLKESFRKNNSKERLDSKIQYPSHKNKDRYDSKEKKHPKFDSAERRKAFAKDSDWHEQLMQHREQARRQRYEHDKNANNWYIERGGSREQLRFR